MMMAVPPDLIAGIGKSPEMSDLDHRGNRRERMDCEFNLLLSAGSTMLVPEEEE
jgi:hypothetical protein